MARHNRVPGTDDNHSISIGTDDNYSIGTDESHNLGSIGTDESHNLGSIKSASERVSVMDWLLAVGHVAARKLRGIPTAPMVRLHPPL
jgi:hypothetical protein